MLSQGVKSTQGVPLPNSYGALNRSERGVYFYTPETRFGCSAFVHVDVATGAQTLLRSNDAHLAKFLSKMIVLPLHSTMAPSQRDVIIVPLVDKTDDDSLYFMVYHPMGDRAVLIQTKQLKLSNSPSGKGWTGGSAGCHLTSEQGEVYFRRYSRNLPLRKTSVSLARLWLDEKDELQAHIHANAFVVDGLWAAPFVYGGYLNLIPWTAPFNKLLLAALENVEMRRLIDTRNSEQVLNRGGQQPRFWYPRLHKGRAFFGILDTTRNVNVLVNFDFNNCTWNWLLELGDHVLVSSIDIFLLQNDTVLIHGRCGQGGCDQKAHFCQFPIPNQSGASDSGSANIHGFNSALVLPTNTTTAPIAKQNFHSNPINEFGAHRYEAIKNAPVEQMPRQLLQSENSADKFRSLSFLASKYHKLKTLGEGAFGKVYLCVEDDLMFAAKEQFVTVEHQKRKLAVEEIKTLQNLKHPRIIDFYGYKEDSNGFITIFMEYMESGSLRSLMNKIGVVSERNTIKYTGQVLEALAYVHEKGIMHCDLKCENLLLDDKGDLKLADFGFAIQLRLDDAKISSMVPADRGTPYFMAPEIWRGEKMGRRADMWRLGCTIVEMLTGNPPYSTIPGRRFIFELNDSASRLDYDPEDLVSSASRQMQRFLAQLLQKDLSNRVPTAMAATPLFRELLLEEEQEESKKSAFEPKKRDYFLLLDQMRK